MTPRCHGSTAESSKCPPPRPLTIHLIEEEDGSSEMEGLLRPDYTVNIWPSARHFQAVIDRAPQGCVIVEATVNAALVRELLVSLGSSELGMPVIVVAARCSLEDAVAFMRLGAVDVILQPADPMRLQTALATACQRLHKSQRRKATLKRVQAVLELLTDREREVLANLTRGFSSKEIGKHLAISPRTVDIHRSNIMGKLNAESLPQALRIAFIAEVCGQYNPTLHVQ